MVSEDERIALMLARGLVAIGNEYPDGFELARHSHRQAQFLYAAQGVLTVDTDQGAWVIPPERAVWIPAGVEHSVRMIGSVSTRNLLLDGGGRPGPSGMCEVLAVSPLLRSLLVEAASLAADYDPAGRDGLLMALLEAEVGRAPLVPLAVPFPRSGKLAGRCRAFLKRPDAQATIDEWCDDLHVERRTFTRAFRRETGMSFARWRQQACLLAALPRLAAGEPVTTVALDLGYDSPAAFSTMVKRMTGRSPSSYRPTPPEQLA